MSADDTQTQNIGETAVASTNLARTPCSAALLLAVSALIIGILCGISCG
jgi:hypothetical protein